MIEAARISFDPLIPWFWFWISVADAMTLWLIYLVLGGRAWLTRGLCLGILMLALSNPLYIKEQREALSDIVAVVLDKSESMRFGTREQAANAVFDAVNSKLGNIQGLEVRYAETNSGADGTDLYRALNTALSDAPRERIAGSIIITDGQIHDFPTEADDTAPLGPIHGLIVGADDEQDRRIEIVSTPNFGIVGETAEISVRVEDNSTQLTPVAVYINGEQHTSRLIRSGRDEVFRFEIPRRGPNLIMVETPAGPNELTLANNRTASNITGVRDRLRVLLVTGEPHAGARVWRDLLKADPSVDLVHFTILRPPHKLDPTPIEELALISFPTHELFVEKLNDFDLVIFDRYRRINVLPMTYFDRLARYVADGGALLVATGPPYAQSASIYRTPLAGILPAQPNGQLVDRAFNVQRTALGERHTVTANLENQNEWGRWQRYVPARAVSGETLLETDTGSPLLVMDRVEDGRVAVLLSDQLWMWARNVYDGGPYAELVRRTAHWLMKEPELEEELLNLSVVDGELQATLRTLSNKAARLEITDPDGVRVTAEWETVEPGVFEAKSPADKLGLYSAQTGRVSAVVLNGPANPREYEDVRSTTEIVQPVSDVGKGGVFRVGANKNITLPDIRRIGETGAASGNNWAGLRRRNAYAVRASEATPLIPGWTGMLAAITFMMLMWRREGR